MYFLGSNKIRTDKAMNTGNEEGHKVIMNYE